MRYAPAVVALALFGATVAAQVPVGHAARFIADTTGSPNPFGIDLVDPDTGSFQPVTGLSASASNIFSGVIDPATGDLWLTGADNTVRRVTLQGAAVVSEQIVVPARSLPFIGIKLDRDGNAFGHDLTTVYRIERHTGVVTPWDTLTAVYPGDLLGGIEIDPVSNTMWAAVGIQFPGPGSIIRWDVDAGPGIATVAGMISFSGWFSPTLNDCSFDGGQRLYVGTGSGIRFLNLQTGLFSLAPGGGFDKTNSVAWDRRRGVLHAVGGRNPPAKYWLYDPPTFSLPVVWPHTIDSPVAVDVNDFLDTTTVFPHAPSAAAGFRLEAAAHGQAGDLAGVVLMSVNGVPIPPMFLGVGFADAGGFLTTSIRIGPGRLPAGTSLGILAVRVDAATMGVYPSNLVTVTLGP